MNMKKYFKIFLICFVMLNIPYMADNQQVEPRIEIIDLDYYW